MKIGILGSSGKMGGFFASYFHDLGHEIYGYDMFRKRIRKVKLVNNIEELVNKSELILVSVPMEKVIDVFNSLPKVKERKKIIEISSMKSKILKKIEEISREKGFELYSIHPLFGPKKQKRLKIAYIQKRKAKDFLKGIFPKCELIEFRDEYEHDKLMAFVICLTHIINIGYASAIVTHLGVKKFKEAWTPFCHLQSLISFAVLSQPPELIYSLQSMNTYTQEAIRIFNLQINRFMNLITKSDKEGFCSLLQKLSKDLPVESSYRAVYKLHEIAEEKLKL